MPGRAKHRRVHRYNDERSSRDSSAGPIALQFVKYGPLVNFHEANLSDAMTLRIAVDIGIVVADLERSLHFYRDLIGLPAIAELPTALVGKGRMVQLRHGASLIKLVELDKPPSHDRSPGISAAFGYRYITLLVTDIETILQKLAAANVAIALPLARLPNGTQVAMVADPDGNIVEFVREAAEPTA